VGGIAGTPKRRKGAQNRLANKESTGREKPLHKGHEGAYKRKGQLQ